MQDDLRSGRPTEINLAELKYVIESESDQSTRNIASKLGCSQKGIHYQFKRLDLVPKLGQWVPHDLSPEQKKKRVDTSHQLLSLRRNFEWLNNLVTGDEKWCLYVNFKRKVQWLKPGQAAKPTPKPGLHPQKRMLSIWWSVKGVIYWELLPEKNTVNAYRYRNQINKLEAVVINKGLFSCKIYFQHDNAKPYIAKIVKEKIDKFGWELLPHPPYSPDLAPSNYHISRMKRI